jgi:Tfp pilus assembly protein PilX
MKNIFPYNNVSKPSKQSGVAILGTVMVLLVIVSMIAITASKSTILETKMVFNMQDKQRSSVAADSAAMLGWNQIKSNFDPQAFINNSEDGYYVLTDAYPVAADAKTLDNWTSNESPAAWSWGDDTKSIIVDQQIGGTSNPMKLVGKPQYAIGIHKEGLRKGTANYHCLPVSIIGASQGGTATTRTLIELRTIPKSTCFHSIVK